MWRRGPYVLLKNRISYRMLQFSFIHHKTVQHKWHENTPVLHIHCYVIITTSCFPASFHSPDRLYICPYILYIHVSVSHLCCWKSNERDLFLETLRESRGHRQTCWSQLNKQHWGHQEFLKWDRLTVSLATGYTDEQTGDPQTMWTCIHPHVCAFTSLNVWLLDTVWIF